MKHIPLKALALSLCFCSCNNLQEELSEISAQEELLPIQFSVDFQEEVLPFPTTKSIPSFDIPEPTVKSAEEEKDPSVPQTEPDVLYRQIEYLVFKKGESSTLVKHKQFKLNDPDFSIIYDSLPKGEYHFCFLAHSDENISIQGETAEFEKVTDTFHRYHSQTIKAGEKVMKDISLKRIISKIEFVATDTVTSDLKDFTMNVEGYQKKIDLMTGLGVSDNATFTNTYSFKEEDFGKLNFTHAFFTFVSSKGSPLNVNLLSTNQLGESTRARKISDIQPQQNYIIRYSGHLYIPPKSNDTFTIDIVNGGIWDDTINNNLAD